MPVQVCVGCRDCTFECAGIPAIYETRAEPLLGAHELISLHMYDLACSLRSGPDLVWSCLVLSCLVVSWSSFLGGDMHGQLHAAAACLDSAWEGIEEHQRDGQGVDANLANDVLCWTL